MPVIQQPLFGGVSWLLHTPRRARVGNLPPCSVTLPPCCVMVLVAAQPKKKKKSKKSKEELEAERKAREEEEERLRQGAARESMTMAIHCCRALAGGS